MQFNFLHMLKGVLRLHEPSQRRSAQGPMLQIPRAGCMPQMHCCQFVLAPQPLTQLLLMDGPPARDGFAVLAQTNMLPVVHSSTSQDLANADDDCLIVDGVELGNVS